jgi:hypothetical protein
MHLAPFATITQSGTTRQCNEEILECVQCQTDAKYERPEILFPLKTRIEALVGGAGSQIRIAKKF